MDRGAVCDWCCGQHDLRYGRRDLRRGNRERSQSSLCDSYLNGKRHQCQFKHAEHLISYLGADTPTLQNPSLSGRVHNAVKCDHHRYRVSMQTYLYVWSLVPVPEIWDKDH